MYHVVLQALFAIAAGASLVASLYACAALAGIGRFRRRLAAERGGSGSGGTRGALPAVTVLKPVYGVDFELYENLRSFCEQDYPAFQVIFAVRSATDPAVAVIERVIADLPGRDLALVVDPTVHGANLKVSNLINAYPKAKHGILLVADSDMRVGPDYLATVAARFRDPAVGVVTCLYRGVSAGGLVSDLACLQINEWFLPSVLVSGLIQGDRYCFGSTMAIRRGILEKAGGFEALSDILADDNMIGRFALDQGYRVALAPYVVDNMVEERSLRALFAHELRWARTILRLNPAGHFFSVLTDTISVAVLCLAAGLAANGADPIAIGAVVLAAALRWALHVAVSRSLAIARPAKLWTIPLRDGLSFAVWAASFFGREVRWRGARFDARRDGSMVKVETLETT